MKGAQSTIVLENNNFNDGSWRVIINRVNKIN